MITIGIFLLSILIICIVVGIMLITIICVDAHKSDDTIPFETAVKLVNHTFAHDTVDDFSTKYPVDIIQRLYEIDPKSNECMMKGIFYFLLEKHLHREDMTFTLPMTYALTYAGRKYWYLFDNRSFGEYLSYLDTHDVIMPIIEYFSNVIQKLGIKEPCQFDVRTGHIPVNNDKVTYSTISIVTDDKLIELSLSPDDEIDYGPSLYLKSKFTSPSMKQGKRDLCVVNLLTNKYTRYYQ